MIWPCQVEAGQRKVDTVVGIMLTTPEAGLDLTKTAWIEDTICYKASSGFHFLLLYLKWKLFMSCGDVHSLFDKYLAKNDQMISVNKSNFFLVPYTCVPIEKGATAMLERTRDSLARVVSILQTLKLEGEVPWW